MACRAFCPPCPPRPPCRLPCLAAGSEGHQCSQITPASVPSPPRRSANYPPTPWNDSFIQSLTSDYMGDAHTAKLEELKGQVRHLLGEVVGVAAELELLDVLQRLGIAYHFEQEIESILHTMSTDLEDIREALDGDLLHTALLFRLLRERGLAVPQDVLNNFIDYQGRIRTSLGKDVEGVLSLYEASLLAYQGEEALQNVRTLATTCLEEFLVDGDVKPELRERVEYAMEIPLHWRAPRMYARWFIDVYATDTKVNPLLLELAKRDFNIVQSAHRRDVRELSRWWNDLGLQNLSFARDRIMECFLWIIGIAFEQHLWYCRHVLTKLAALISTIDDVYDIYGSIDELESFTKAIERWDIDAMEGLPDYMKVCFMSFIDTTNEFVDECFKRNGINCLSYFKNVWINLCKSYLVEARWYHSKHMPTFEEYMGNAWISIAVPTLLTHAYFFLSDKNTSEALDTIESHCDLIYLSSIIIRLHDDLGTSEVEQKRGDVPKSVQCLMHEENVPEVVARERIKVLISDAWIKINKEFANKHLSKSLIKVAINFGRMSQFFYQDGDGFGAANEKIASFAKLSLIESIN